ncbi:MAG: carboxypeptidase regulatory-like domain-containing protein, partial [Siphonobacter sp.]
MRHHLLSALLCVLAFGLHAQNPSRITVKGRIVDTTNAPLSFATVMLLTPKDSALVSYARADDKGFFELKNVKRAVYLVKTSYVGYLPYQREFSPQEGSITDLGDLKMKLISKELFEVVVKTAKAPLDIRGDTIEYNAKSFKVPPGSTVEDLLRRLPGFQIDQDGGIKAQGQEVKRVTVDGKNFFGGDPKTATKNLSAEAIDKVQVYNSQSEQSKATGIDDGKKEKTVNLALKEEFKKGGFGKIKAGVGTNERVDVRGNYNKFNEKRQFAVIGLGNNINQSGMSWDDRQDFYGSSTYRWDEVDFGFGGGITN